MFDFFPSGLLRVLSEYYEARILWDRVGKDLNPNDVAVCWICIVVVWLGGEDCSIGKNAINKCSILHNIQSWYVELSEIDRPFPPPSTTEPCFSAGLFQKPESMLWVYSSWNITRTTLSRKVVGTDLEDRLIGY